MRTIHEIQQFPRSFDRREIEAQYMGHDSGLLYWKGDVPSGWHESLLRSYQILTKVKDLLDKGTPSSVVRELITEMER